MNVFETTKHGTNDDKVSRFIRTAGLAVPAWKKLVLTDPLDNSLLQTNSRQTYLNEAFQMLEGKGIILVALNTIWKP